jgi:SAM-dependent methyltransferase
MVDQKTRALATTLRALVFRPGEQVRRVLVVGCGDGYEAADLAEFFECAVDAIDVENYFTTLHARVSFRQMDARALEFSDETFDVVYSFHAIEHIPEPERAMTEMRRVLRRGGTYMIGVPNRSRILGYITGRNATFQDKVVWNLIDWRARLRGKFRNECGAHAGFTFPELAALSRPVGEPIEATREYYEQLYPRYRRLIALIVSCGFAKAVFPCLYCVGRRSG